MISLFFVTKLLTALVTDQNNTAGAQLQCFPDEISKSESFLVYFESHEEAFLDWARQRREASAQWPKCASSYHPLDRCLFEASGRVKSKL